MQRSPNPVTDAIDGATGDLTTSGDAMRWSPELADAPEGSTAGGLLGIDVGALLLLDGAGVRRLVSRAGSSLATVAAEVAGELRRLTAGPAAGDGPPADR